MCNCYDGDAPACFTQKNRRARKPHSCIECSKAIAPGTVYEHISGIWDGRPDSFSTCLRCVVLREAHVKAEEALQRHEAEEMGLVSLFEACNPVIGTIQQTIGECAREEPVYVREFRKARRELMIGQAGR